MPPIPKPSGGGNLNWSIEEYEEQHRRLAHARQHAHFYIYTDPLTPDQVHPAGGRFSRSGRISSLDCVISLLISS